MGYGRCFSHSAENSCCYWLLSTAFELRSFQHIHHAISIRRFPFHSMLWVEILLAWHHLEYFFEENATSFCLSIQMICLLKVDQRLVNFCTEDLSWSPEMNFASRPLNQCRWPLSPKFMTWLISYKLSMVFSFSDCGSAVLEWICRASSLEPHEDTKVDIPPKIRSYRPDLIMMTWYFALLTWLYTF